MDPMHTAMLVAFGMILVGLARLAIVGWRRTPTPNEPGLCTASIDPSALANVPAPTAETISQNLRDRGMQPDQRMDGGERRHVATPFEKAIEEII